jgi:glycosyltransferase involved in cell wall biosynthesis
VLTISESDRSKMHALGCKVRLENFPVVLNIDLYNIEIPHVEYPSLFHIGSMDFQPAVEGLEWFLDNVWNDLRALNSGIKLHLAGRNMPDEFYAREDDHLIIHDELEDGKEFIGSKSIMIVPLRSGSGMRVKIIEGMAMRKCIISTSLGAEGINYQHGKNILIADTPDEFYKNILRCSTDCKFCEEIGENARKLVEKEHNVVPASASLLNFYRELTSG